MSIIDARSDTAARTRRYGAVVVAFVIGFGCAAAALATAQAPLGTADETAHLDYAIGVWSGRLPVFEDGLDFTPSPPAQTPPVQWVAQHPPGYYALLAPVVGPLVERSDWRTVTMAGRVITALIGMGLLGSVAWTSSVVFGGDRRRVVATVGATATMAAPLLVSAAVYNDVLATALTTLALGVGASLLLSGVTWPRVVAMAVVCAAGMLTRGSFAATMLVLLGALAVSGLLDTTDTRVRRWLRTAAAGIAVVVAAALAAGWFYLRNVRLTGSWTGGHPEWAEANLDRVSQPVFTIARSGLPWQPYIRLFFSEAGGWTAITAHVVPVLTVVSGAIVALRRRSWLRLAGPQRRVIAMLAVQTVFTVLIQIVYISGGGGANFRYALPALLPLAVCLGASLTAEQRWRVWPLAGFCVTGLLLLTVHILTVVDAAGGQLVSGAPAWVPLGWLFAAAVAVAAALTGAAQWVFDEVLPSENPLGRTATDRCSAAG